MKTPDPQLCQEMLDTNHKPYQDAYNQNDAAALAAFYTEDAVFVTDREPVYGREAIERWYADLLTEYHASNFIGRPDQYSPHIIGTGGTELWSNGDWSVILKPKTGDSTQLNGKWSCIYVREGNAWKAQMHIYNLTPEPAPPV
jgi:uncharacterized protein (TIGR02246 family)